MNEHKFTVIWFTPPNNFTRSPRPHSTMGQRRRICRPNLTAPCFHALVMQPLGVKNREGRTVEVNQFPFGVRRAVLNFNEISWSQFECACGLFNGQPIKKWGFYPSQTSRTLTLSFRGERRLELGEIFRSILPLPVAAPLSRKGFVWTTRPMVTMEWSQARPLALALAINRRSPASPAWLLLPADAIKNGGRRCHQQKPRVVLQSYDKFGLGPFYVKRLIAERRYSEALKNRLQLAGSFLDALFCTLSLFCHRYFQENNTQDPSTL